MEFVELLVRKFVKVPVGKVREDTTSCNLSSGTQVVSY